MCGRWNDFSVFLKDMGNAPSPQHTIERKNNNKDYSPSNCRWASRTEQMLNTRVNHLLTYQGRTQPVAAWAEEIGLPADTLFRRLYRKWPVEKALTLPHGSRNWKERPF